jgi:hypothetical protein
MLLLITKTAYHLLEGITVFPEQKSQTQFYRYVNQFK